MITCKEYVSNCKAKIKTENKLSIFQVGDNLASNSYIKGKIKDCEEVGIQCTLHKFPESITQDELMIALSQTSDKVILQLPVPAHINPIGALEKTITPMQDVDGFLCNSPYLPCTPKGIVDYLEKGNNISFTGKNVVVIGRSHIVGKPLSNLLTNKDATVTLCHSKTKPEDLEYICKNADIIIVAVGKPKFFNFKVDKKTPIIIDVGINRDEQGKLCGDVDYDAMTEQGCYVTPVPCGVGLLTRLALLENIAMQD